MTTTKDHDFLNRLKSISSAPSASSAVSFNYTYNAANQRTNCALADNRYWRYEYDSLGQVTSGKKYWADGSPIAGQQFAYSFDDIGNRKYAASGGDQWGANLRYSFYGANSVNQYTNRTLPPFLDVLGTAATASTVTVSNQPAYRKGEYFRAELQFDNSAAPVWASVTNIAVLNQGSNPDIVTTNIGTVFLPQTPEIFRYDPDGNLTNDGRWTYTWDTENRLIQVESLSSAPIASKRKVVWEFDGAGRRVHQTTYDGGTGSWAATEDLKFLADGWRHIAELNATNHALVRTYVWGLDLSGSLDGAGGVGGLLLVNRASNGAHFFAFDGNGNTAALVSAADGTVSARYEYDPFGRVIRRTGTVSDENRFQFSTKRHDRATDLEMYEFRARRPDLAWLSRDPIAEKGGSNLYGFCSNDPMDTIDPDGHITFEGCETDHQRTIQSAVNEACSRILSPGFGCCWGSSSLATQYYLGLDVICSQGQNFKVVCSPERFVSGDGCAATSFRLQRIRVSLSFFTNDGCGWGQSCVMGHEMLHLVGPVHPRADRAFNRLHSCLGCARYREF